jgi:hypothetical protein
MFIFSRDRERDPVLFDESFIASEEGLHSGCSSEANPQL